jgi:hypothetical protein
VSSGDIAATIDPTQGSKMSLISRLFGKSRPAPVAPAASTPPAPAESTPKPDPAVKAREEEAAVQQAIAAGDATAIGKWVLEGSTTRIRQLAAQAVTDPDQLRELVRLTRGKDKNAHRILATRRDAQLAEERAAQQLRAEIDAAAAAIATHVERPCDASYVATLARLETRWQSVAAQASAGQQQDVAIQVARGREAAEQYRRTLEAEVERKRTAAEAAAAARHEREAEEQAAAAAAAERAQQEQAEHEAERVRREADEAEVRRLIGLLRQAQAALEHGGTARATRLRDAIKEAHAAAPALPAWFERKLQDLDARIEELKDWKTFTVVPKRAELVQRMQGLVGASMSPEELARQVRRLRDEWRTLHRGMADEATPEREQFEAAAERAYEPCRTHFAQQAEQRKENQARREALLERLAAFAAEHADENADLRLVQQALAEARREWRQYAPVDQDVVTSLQERFHAVTDGLQARLDAEYARNVETKQRLIARAAELVAAQDIRQAIEETKDLQRAWKNVGFVPRQQDNALWEEFRRHCDAVFERSSQESAAYGAALEANRARAMALCEDVELIAALAGDALADAARRLEPLRAEFESLELPRASARDLRQRFTRATERCRDALQRQRAESELRGWADAFAASARIRSLALATIRQGAPDELAELRAAAEQAVAGLTHAPASARAILERQLAAVAAGTVSADLAASEAALRKLCIRAELLTDVPTPPEDLELRREYQMQRLVQSMGRGERASPADLDDLALEWLAVGPVEESAQDELLARFERCRTARAS